MEQAPFRGTGRRGGRPYFAWNPDSGPLTGSFASFPNQEPACTIGRERQLRNFHLVELVSHQRCHMKERTATDQNQQAPVEEVFSGGLIGWTAGILVRGAALSDLPASMVNFPVKNAAGRPIRETR